MKRPAVVASFVASALLATLAVWQVHRVRAYDVAYGRVTGGMDKAAVTDLLGNPDRIERDPGRAFWGPQVLPEAVAAEVRYEHWYTVRRWAAVPVSWTVGFDANGRVVSKHRWD